MTASLICSTALAVCLAGPVLAQDKRAVVVAGSAAERAQAVAMSEALLGLGFDVQRLEAPEAADLAAAFEELDAVEGPAAVYYAGDDLAVAPAFRASDAPRFVFLDGCFEAAAELTVENALVLAPAGDCAVDLSQVLLDRLTVPGLQTEQWALDAGISVTSTLDVPFVFRQAGSDVRLTADDYAMLDTLSPVARDRMIRLWRDAGIAVDVSGGGSVGAGVVTQDAVRVTPVSPVAPVQVVRPIAGGASGGVSRVTDNVAIVARPLTAPTDLPTAGEGGLPQPSILVGYVVENLPQAPSVPDEPLAGTAFGTDDVTAREALRAQDAVVFEGLVETGAFDPPDAEITRALQVELARINCYTAGIDGAWGPGSQRALLAFYEEIGEAPSGTDADLDSFRAVITRDNVRCPDPPPVQVAQPVAPPRAAQPTAQSTRVAPAPTPAPTPAAPAPAPAAPESTRRSINQVGGTGVFR